MIYDVIIIGGGPAGMSAAIYAARARLKTLIIEKAGCGGQIAITDHLENYPGFETGINGFELAVKMQTQATTFGSEITYGEVLSVEVEGNIKRVVLQDKVFETKTIIIEKLLKQKNENDIIPTKSLAAATRRIISRYLAGKRAVTDIGEDRDLTFELCREELWEEKIGQLEDLMDFVIVKMNGIKLNVGQAFEFYNIIGEEDRNALNFNNK